jgi:hypothetical protein
VKPKFIVPLFLIIILGASVLLYLKTTRERDLDLDYTQKNEDGTKPEIEERVKSEEETERARVVSARRRE